MAVILTITLVFFSPAALATDYTYTTINVPGADPSLIAAFGINDGGTIVGYYLDNTGGENDFLYASETFSTIDSPGTSTIPPNGINEFGTIVGYYLDFYGDYHGFLTTPVPDSITLLLLGLGLIGLVGLGREIRKLGSKNKK